MRPPDWAGPLDWDGSAAVVGAGRQNILRGTFELGLRRGLRPLDFVPFEQGRRAGDRHKTCSNRRSWAGGPGHRGASFLRQCCALRWRPVPPHRRDRCRVCASQRPHRPRAPLPETQPPRAWRKQERSGQPRSSARSPAKARAGMRAGRRKERAWANAARNQWVCRNSNACSARTSKKHGGPCSSASGQAERDKYLGAWPQRQTMSPRGVIWDSQATRSTNMCRRCSTPTVTTVMSTLRPCTTVGVPKVQGWFAKLTPLRQKVAPNAPIQLPLARQAEAAEAVPPTTRRAAAHGRRRRGATPSTEDTPQDIMVGGVGSMRGRLNGCGGASACCSGSVM